MSTHAANGQPEQRLVSSARAGDEAAFATLAARYRAELQLHCYRMLGSFQDAEDLVQETLLRAWSKRATYQGRATFRAWLYGIATNACLDALRRRQKRVLPSDVYDPADPHKPPQAPEDVPWLEPFPDRLLEEAASGSDEPEARLLARETTELAFLAAIQHLSPRQRAVLILRDILEWSAMETATTLETSVASVNSALQRAHAALAEHLTAAGETSPGAASAHELELLEGLIAAWEQADADALAALLREDARLVMPPTPSWYDGREAIRTFFATYAFSAPDLPSRIRILPTRANRQPALAVYLRDRGGRDDEERRPFALAVVDAAADGIRRLTLFHLPELFDAWGLPETA
jgi:RNA polymerase sigma-70 factor (ECF subfamily)